MVLASVSDFLGNMWFAGLALVVGYVAGTVFPISKITGLFNR